MLRIPFLAAALFLALLPGTVFANDCQFMLGFKAHRDFLGHNVVGECLENERFHVDGAQQRTTNGTLYWSREDNYVRFVPNAAPTATPRPDRTPIPTSQPRLTPTPEPVAQVECPTGQEAEDDYFSRWEGGITGWLRDYHSRRIAFQVHTINWVCRYLQALGWEIDEGFAWRYISGVEYNWRGFEETHKQRHIAWCIIEEDLLKHGTDDDVRRFRSMLNYRYEWRDYRNRECRRELLERQSHSALFLVAYGG